MVEVIMLSALKWWVTTDDDPEMHTYEEWVLTAEDIEAYGMEQDDEVFVLVNSTELRMVGFQMDPVEPPLAPTAHGVGLRLCATVLLKSGLFFFLSF